MHAERQTARVSLPLPAFPGDAAGRSRGFGAGGPLWLDGPAVYGCGVALYLGTLTLCARRVTADGYDGVGFVLALGRLDLARWQPQPPGYPLLVLLGRATAACGLPPAVAVATVNAALLGAGLMALAWGIRRLAGPRAGFLAALLLPVGPLAFALALSTLSDAAGLGALLLAVAPLLQPMAPSPRRLWGSGLGAGLALGVRPSYAPLVGLLLLVLWWQAGGRAALRAALALALASLGWLVPLAVWVGPRALWALSLAHAQGHFADVGGTVANNPSAGHRLGDFLLVCGLGSVGPLVPLWVGLGAAALYGWPPRRWSVAARRLGSALVALIAGYGLWVLLALPVHGHGRHVLPLTVALLALLAVIVGSALAAPVAQRRPAFLLCTALAIGALWGYSVRTAWAFRRSLSPGAALAEYVVTHFPAGTPLYGARAARPLDALLGSGSARPAQYLGEAIADAERPDHRASTILLTSEVRVPAAAAPLLSPVGRFCYSDAVPRWLRPDRFALDCVTLFAYRVRP